MLYHDFIQMVSYTLTQRCIYGWFFVCMSVRRIRRMHPLSWRNIKFYIAYPVIRFPNNTFCILLLFFIMEGIRKMTFAENMRRVFVQSNWIPFTVSSQCYRYLFLWIIAFEKLNNWLFSTEVEWESEAKKNNIW